jgi:predicted DNA binding CopG/RHH family protein
MKRQVPKLTTDEEAEAFLDQDLSDLDFSQFKPARFEFEKREKGTERKREKGTERFSARAGQGTGRSAEPEV